MDTLPLEIVDHIASYLRAYEKEKYKFDEYVNHNRLATRMYIKNEKRDQHQHRTIQYYKRCVLCGRELE
jgi:hypothetical protein